MSSDNELVQPISVHRNYVASQSSLSQNHLFNESCTNIQEMFAVITHRTDTFKPNSATPSPFFDCVKNAAACRITEYAINHHTYNESVKEAYTNAISIKYLKIAFMVKTPII